ncbi:MAG: YceI family protein [Flavobacterium sp.]
MSTTKWIIDPTHSEIGFRVRHMMFSNVSGKFQKFESTIETEGDNFEKSTIRFNADVASITTGNADRDTHLLSPDFFDTAKYPKIIFNAESFAKKNDGEYILTGSLEMHGTTKTISLPIEYSGLLKDPWGNIKAAFAIDTRINRKDWGLNWNSVLETGGLLVSDEVRLVIELQFIKQ